MIHDQKIKLQTFPPKVKRRAQNIAFRGQVTRRPPSAPVFHLFSH